MFLIDTSSVFRVGLNIFNSGIKFTEKDWVMLEVQHYPLRCLFSVGFG